MLYDTCGGIFWDKEIIDDMKNVQKKTYKAVT
jgi:hypothetical protein